MSKYNKYTSSEVNYNNDISSMVFDTAVKLIEIVLQQFRNYYSILIILNFEKMSSYYWYKMLSLINFYNASECC